MANDYIPALRFAWLTPWYDWTVAWSTRDAAMKANVIELAHPQLGKGKRVLDVGCGTGTLVLALARSAPGVDVVGVDADPAILEMARAKAGSAGVQVEFIVGQVNALRFPDASFDLVISTLVFHHLLPEMKRQALREIQRMLRPGGRLLIADFGRASSFWRRTMFNLVRLLDGFPNTRDHAQGTLAGFVRDAGFTLLASSAPMAVPIGSIDFILGQRGHDT
jgi:ubiquinone/menaquinone biosynthesis C-methylase UbiE